MSQKIIKRVLAFVLSFAMILGSVSIGQAEEVLTVKAGTPDAVMVGEDVIVPITLENNAGSISGLQFKVTYDANVLTYKNTTSADLLKNGVVDINDTTAGSVGVAYVTVESPITTNGKLCDIAFTAKASTEQSSVEVTGLKALTLDVTPIAVQGVGATVVVNEPDYKIAGSETTAKQGATATVEFTVSDNKLTDVEGLDFEVSYDAGAFTVVETDVTAGALLADAYVDVNVEESGKIGVMSISTTDIVSGNGELVKIKFSVKPGAEPKDYPVGLTVVKLLDSNINKMEKSGTIVPGKITVTVDTLPAYKTAAKAAVDTARASYKDADYDAAGVTALNKAVTDAKAAIDAATTEAAVDAAKQAGVNALAAVKTKAEKASEEAAAWKTSHKTILAKTVNTVKTTDEAAVDAAITAYGQLSNDAKALVTAEKTLLDALKAKIKELNTPVDTLPAYKTAAKAAVDTARASYKDADYDAEGVTALNKAVTDAKAAIDAATTEAAVDAAKQAGVNALAAVKTKAEKASEEAAAWETSNNAIISKPVDTVKVSDEAAVDAALAAYEKLSDAAKEAAKGEKDLLDALKAKIEELKAGDTPTPTPPVSGGYVPATPSGDTETPSVDDPNKDNDDIDLPKKDAYVKVYRTMAVGQNANVDLPAGNDVSIVFSSSQPEIIAVTQDGEITANKEGKGNISVYVTKGDVTTKTTIRIKVVSKNKAPDSRELGDVDVTVGGTPVTSVTKTLKVDASSKIEVINLSGADVTYYSNNTKVATVTSSGKIIAEKAGKTTIIAEVTLNGITMKYRVRVTVKK